MAVQVRRTGSSDYGRYIKALFAGPGGSGKTLMSSTFPNPIFAAAEPGLMSVADRNIPVVDIKTSQDLLDLAQALDQEPKVREKMLGVPVDTVVIDTFDECGLILQKERNTDQRRDAFQMQDWGWYGDQLRSVLRRFRNLEMNVVFTVHVRSKEDGETGAVKVVPNIQGQVGDELSTYFDLVLMLRSRQETEMVNGEARRKIIRYAQTYPDSRHEWVKDRSGKLPMEFLINFEDDYKRLDSLIYGHMPSPAEQQAQEHAAAKDAVVAIAADLQEKAEKAPEVQADPIPVVELLPISEPEPEPEPVSEPVPAEDPVPDVETPEEPALEAVSDVQASVAVPAAPAAADEDSDSMICEECGKTIETEDMRDLSRIRFRKRLCQADFLSAKKKK